MLSLFGFSIATSENGEDGIWLNSVTCLSHFLCHKPNSPPKRIFLNNCTDKTGERSLHNAVPVNADEKAGSKRDVHITQFYTHKWVVWVTQMVFLHCISREAVLKGKSEKKSEVITPEDVRAPKLGSSSELAIQDFFLSHQLCGEPGKTNAWMEGYINYAYSACPQPFKTCLIPAVKLLAQNPSVLFMYFRDLKTNSKTNKKMTFPKARTKKECILKHMKCWDLRCPWNTTAYILFSLSSLTKIHKAKYLFQNVLILEPTNPHLWGHGIKFS